MKNVVLCVLLLESFWGVNVVDYKLTQTLVSMFFFVYFVFYHLQKRRNEFSPLIRNFDKFILCIFASLFLNATASWLNRGQDLFLTFCTLDFRNFLSLFFFYYLIRKNYSIRKVEKALEILYWSYCVCFLLEYFVFFPFPVFRLIGLTLSEHRFRLVGQLINFIGYFYFLNKYLVEKRKKHIFACFLGFLCIFLLGFRSFLFALAIVSLVQIFRVKGVSKSLLKIILVSSLAACVASQFSFSQNIVTNMMNRQKGQEKMGDDYIRLREWRYFTEDHFLNGWDRFFGSGPENEKSQYGKKMAKFRIDDGYSSRSIATWWDWGLIGLSWSMGMPLALLLFLLLLYMIFLRTEKKYMYISSVYLLLLITGVSTIEMYRFGAFTFHAIMIFLVCKINEEKELKNESWNNNAPSVF